MASADCECCGQPTTAPEPVPAEPEECDCDCYDCDLCDECCWDDEYVEDVTPVVLCGECTEDGEGCGPGAWHCRCGRACDGSACPGPQERLSGRRYAEFDELLQANGVIE